MANAKGIAAPRRCLAAALCALLNADDALGDSRESREHGRVVTGDEQARLARQGAHPILSPKVGRSVECLRDRRVGVYVLVQITQIIIAISIRRARSAPATRLETGKFASAANRTA